MDHDDRAGRLHWWLPAELSERARELYERITGGPRSRERTFPLADEDGRLYGPFNAMLYAPEVGLALQEVGSALRFRGMLPGRAREIAILEVSVARRCAFEWFAHERVARGLGLTDEELAALAGGSAAASLDAFETCVRETVRALVRDRDLDDAAFARAATVIGEGALMELIALVGYYDLLALSLVACRTPLPPGASTPFA